MQNQKLFSSLSKTTMFLLTFVLVGSAFILTPGTASAHCDTLDGPVAMATKKAMETNNVNHMLVWVQPQDEDKIRHLFQETMENYHKSGKSTSEMDMKLLEEMVRIHREGEGATYEGLKPAGMVEPSIAALDNSLKAGNSEELNHLLTENLKKRMDTGVKELSSLRNYNTDDVSAGRKYVAEYVTFAHYVEGIDKMLTETPAAHHADTHATEKHAEENHNLHNETSLKHDENEAEQIAFWDNPLANFFSYIFSWI